MREFAVSVLVRLQDRLSQPLGGLQRRLQGLGRLGERLGLGRVGSQLANVGKQFTLLAGVAAAAFTAIGGGAWAMARSIANAGDSAFKTSQRIGVNVETLQELLYGASLSDLSESGLERALSTLNQKAAEGDELFAKLGIALKDSQGNLRDSGEYLKDLADIFASLEDGVDKSALATKLFGDRLGRELIPFLNEGREGLEAMGKEARDLGIVLPEELAKASVEWNDNITRLGAVFQGIKMELFAPLIPIFNDLTVAFRAFIQENKADIIAAVASAIQRVVDAIPAMIDGFKMAGDIIGGVMSVGGTLVEMLGGMETVAIAVGAAISAKLAIAIVGLGAALLTTPIGWFIIGVTTIALLAKTIYENWDGIAEWFGEMWGKVKEDGEVAFDFLKALFAWTPLGMLVASFGPALDWLKSWWPQVETLAADAFDTLKTLFAWHPLALIVANWGPISDFMATIWGGIKDGFSEAWDGIEAGFSSLIGFLGEWMSKAVEAFYAGPGPLLEAGAKIIQALWDGIKAKFAELIEWLKGVPGMIADAIGNIDPVGAIKDRVSAGIGTIGEGASNAASAVGEGIGNAASTAGDWAKRAWNWSTGDTPQLAAPAAAMAAGRSANDNSAAPLRSQPQEADVSGVIKIEVTGPGKVTSAENSNRGVRMAPNRGQSLVNE